MDVAIWEQGLGIGVVAVILSIFGWLIRRLVLNWQTAQETLATQRHAENVRLFSEAKALIKETETTLIGVINRVEIALKAALNERDRACNQDHIQLVDHVDRLNSNLSQLTVLFDYIVKSQEK